MTKKAFTLTEFIVAIVILIIMISFSTAEYMHPGPPPIKGNVQKDHLKYIKKAIDQFYSEKGRYPKNLNELTDTTHPYFSEIPTDPFTGIADWELREKEPQDKWYANPISESGYPGSPPTKWTPNTLSGIFDIRPRPVK